MNNHKNKPEFADLDDPVFDGPEERRRRRSYRSIGSFECPHVTAAPTSSPDLTACDGVHVRLSDPYPESKRDTGQINAELLIYLNWAATLFANMSATRQSSEWLDSRVRWQLAHEQFMRSYVKRS